LRGVAQDGMGQHVVRHRLVLVVSDKDANHDLIRGGLRAGDRDGLTNEQQLLQQRLHPV